MIFAPGTRVHIIGVGGAGMSGDARLLHDWGCVVTGSDASSSDVLNALAAAGITVYAGHNAIYGAEATVVLWSPAIAPDHVELLAARTRGAQLIARSELFAVLAENARVIGLTGTHGKTTATSMMVHVVAASGRDDGRLLGADVRGVGANGAGGSTGELIVEVDESYGTFTHLRPAALGVLNVDADHLDHYGSLDVLESAFAAVVDRTSGPVVVWSDDPGARRLVDRVQRPVTTVALSGASWTVDDVVLDRRSATFALRGPQTLAIRLQVTGAHNVANAAVVAVLALELGVSVSAVQTGLSNFRGAPRRFEFRGKWRGIDVYEDYAHLPGEIAATLQAARDAGYDRVAAVFQPHRVTRTLAVGDAFAPAFDNADAVMVTDIYTAGEANPDHVTGERVADPLRRRRGDVVTYCPNDETLLAALERVEADALFVLGAGNVASCLDSLELTRD